jgi:hypothetical protein
MGAAAASADHSGVIENPLRRPCRSGGRRPRLHRERLLAAVGGVLAALAVAAPAAHAGLVAPTASDCAPETATHPFLPWLDPAHYVLVDDGGFEADASGWRLDGARTVTGNEPWEVRGGDDAGALAIGGVATSPPVCVGLGHPTIRFFARNTGAATGALTVQVVARTSLGTTLVLPIGTVGGPLRAWAPMLPMPVIANLLPLLPGARTQVSFRFAAVGDGSAWEIDDVYVDPYSKR